jgi:hypothetical protein
MGCLLRERPPDACAPGSPSWQANRKQPHQNTHVTYQEQGNTRQMSSNYDDSRITRILIVHEVKR